MNSDFMDYDKKIEILNEIIKLPPGEEIRKCKKCNLPFLYDGVSDECLACTIGIVFEKWSEKDE